MCQRWMFHLSYRLNCTLSNGLHLCVQPNRILYKGNSFGDHYFLHFAMKIFIEFDLIFNKTETDGFWLELIRRHPVLRSIALTCEFKVLIDFLLKFRSQHWEISTYSCNKWPIWLAITRFRSHWMLIPNPSKPWMKIGILNLNINLV